jgi:hypothetical protein
MTCSIIITGPRKVKMLPYPKNILNLRMVCKRHDKQRANLCNGSLNEGAVCWQRRELLPKPPKVTRARPARALGARAFCAQTMSKKAADRLTIKSQDAALMLAEKCVTKRS